MVSLISGKQVHNILSDNTYTPTPVRRGRTGMCPIPAAATSRLTRETHSLRYKNYCMTKAMDTDECILRQYRTGQSNTGTDLLTKTHNKATIKTERHGNQQMTKTRHWTEFRQELNDTGVAQT